MTYIYALVDPETNQIRYVGKADKPFSRLGRHIKEADRRGNHKECWIYSLLSKGMIPQMFVLEEVSSNAWEVAERKWIAFGKSHGWDLTNVTEGGEGGATTTGMPSWNKGKHGIFSEEALRKISETSKRKRSAETKRRMSEAVKRRITPEEEKERLRHLRVGMPAWNKGKHGVQSYGPQSEEHRKKIGDARRRYWIRWREERGIHNAD